MCCKLDRVRPLLKIVDLELAQVSGTTPATLDATFRATNPTKKLHLTLHVFARSGKTGAGQGPQAHDYTGETWQLRAAVKSGSEEIPLNAAFVDASNIATARALPDSRDIWDGVKVIHGTAHLVNNANPQGDIYVVQAIWEPVDSCMGPEERDYWFSLCDLTGNRSSNLPTVGAGA